jgi:hypothetical protein
MSAPGFLALAVACILIAAAASADVLDFETDRAGEPPAGFTIAQTGPGEPPRWLVEADPSAPDGKHVLVQRSADVTRARFPSPLRGVRAAAARRRRGTSRGDLPHSYHMDYGANAKGYVDAFFANLRIEEVNRRLGAATRGQAGEGKS